VTLLLKLSQLIDWLIERVGKGAFWLVLVVTLIGAGNAVMRYIWNYSSNAFSKSSGTCFRRFSFLAPATR
jgi:TRAP-type mannitol/chloroaromatic compound transport system permease small subunit